MVACRGGIAGTSVEIGDILFVKIEEDEGGEQAAQQTAAKSPAAAKTGGNNNNKGNKGGGKKEAAPPAPSDPFEAADIRVGQIVKVSSTTSSSSRRGP